jgi:hypothetical protein
MKSWGLGSLDDSGSVQRLARMVQDHEHFGELLRACEPALRREMYEAMSPNLRFPARSLESYIIDAKEHAASMEFPTLDESGNLKPYTMPTIGSWLAGPIDPQFELYAVCSRCDKASIFFGERKADAISAMRHAGWAWNELAEQACLCPDCLDNHDWN